MKYGDFETQPSWSIKLSGDPRRQKDLIGLHKISFLSCFLDICQTLIWKGKWIWASLAENNYVNNIKKKHLKYFFNVIYHEARDIIWEWDRRCTSCSSASAKNKRKLPGKPSNLASVFTASLWRRRHSGGCSLRQNRLNNFKLYYNFDAYVKQISLYRILITQDKWILKKYLVSIYSTSQAIVK